MFQIEFYQCDKSKEECESNEVIEKYLDNTKVSIYISDTMIKTRNYKNPFERGLKEYFYYVSSKNYLHLTQYFRTLRIISDDGLIFTSESEKSTFTLDYIKECSLKEVQGHFLHIGVQFTNVLDVYYRKYYKLQDFAAQIGGVFKVLLIVGYIIVSIYYENSFMSWVISKYFIYNETEIKLSFVKKEIKEINNCYQNENKNCGMTMNELNNGSRDLVIRRNIEAKRRIREENLREYTGCKAFFPIQVLKRFDKKRINQYMFWERAVTIIKDNLDVISILKNCNDLNRIKSRSRIIENKSDMKKANSLLLVNMNRKEEKCYLEFMPIEKGLFNKCKYNKDILNCSSE